MRHEAGRCRKQDLWSADVAFTDFPFRSSSVDRRDSRTRPSRGSTVLSQGALSLSSSSCPPEGSPGAGPGHQSCSA
eukprot:12446115-Heterocapsa_arctica.AAC.1